MNKLGLNLIIYTLIIAIFCLIGCKLDNAKQDSSNGKIKIDEHEFIYFEDTIGWKCDNIDLDLVCYPEKWYKYPQEKIFFLALVEEGEPSTSLAICKYNLDTCEFNLESFVRIFYNTAQVDTIEKLTSSNIIKLDYKNRTSYYVEMSFTNQKLNYKSMTMIFTSNNFLYDMSLKGHLEDFDRNKIYFQSILYKFKTNNEYIFSPELPLKSISEVDISKFE